MDEVKEWRSAANRREIAEWRDRHLLAAARTMNSLAIELADGFEEDVRRANWVDMAFTPDAFVARTLDPKVRIAAEPKVAKLLADAGHELNTLMVTWPTRPAQDSVAGDPAAWRDAAWTAGPLVAGLTVAMAVPAAAISTASVMFGLITVTTVSWSVVAVGGAVAAAAVATGAVNGNQILSRARDRLRTRARDCLGVALLADGDDPPSVLTQLRIAIDAAAERARTA